MGWAVFKDRDIALEKQLRCLPDERLYKIHAPQHYDTLALLHELDTGTSLDHFFVLAPLQEETQAVFHPEVPYALVGKIESFGPSSSLETRYLAITHVKERDVASVESNLHSRGAQEIIAGRWVDPVAYILEYVPVIRGR